MPVTMGSPPQMRGKPKWTDARGQEKRITPADAGKTDYDGSGTNVYRDHPRRCGENCLTILLRVRVQGSPPQMRGKPPEKLSKCLI